jgi:hypothetical protein
MADYGSIDTILPPSFPSHKGFCLLYALELTDYVSVSDYIPDVTSHCVLLLFCYIPLVPKKLDIDWKAIEGMYMMGMQPEVICSTYRINNHTLTSKIVRGGWKGKKDALLARKEVVVQEARTQMVANAGTAYQERLIKHIDAGLAVLDENLPTTRPEVSQHFDALGKVDKIAVRAYGLESTVHGSQSTTLNLNLLRVDATPCTPETSAKKAEVIDVQ